MTHDPTRPAQAGAPTGGPPPGEVAREIAKALLDIPFPMEPLSTRPVFLAPALYRELFDATGAMLGLLHKALLASSPTDAGRITALGAALADYPAFMPSAHERRFTARMSRPDVIIDSTGPRFLEFNTGIGGIVETALAAAVWARLYGARGELPFRPVDGLRARDAFFAKAAAELDVPNAVAIVGTRRDSGYDNRALFDVQVASLRKSGASVEFFEPEQIDGGICSQTGRFPLMLRHFTVPEWREKFISIDPVARAIATGCVTIPTQSDYLLTNKKLLAILSAGQPWMTEEDRFITARYLPWTRVLRHGQLSWRGRSRDAVELLSRHQEEFVIKPAIGLQARNVLLGAFCDTAHWRQAVSKAVDSADYIVQEYVEGIDFEMSFSSGARADEYRGSVRPIFGPFYIDGTDGGCMVRYLAPGNCGPVGIPANGALINIAVEDCRTDMHDLGLQGGQEDWRLT